MRKYQGKPGTVDAAKIEDISPNEGDLILAHGGGRISKSREWHRQNKPQRGDWYVLEASGNDKVMSSAEFEAEFEAVPDTTIPVNQGSNVRQAARDDRAAEAEGRPKTREQAIADDREKQRVADEQRAIDEAAEKKRRADRAAGLPQQVQARENAAHVGQESLQPPPASKPQTETSDAKQNTEAGANDAGRSARQAVREEGRNPAEGGKGVRAGRQG